MATNTPSSVEVLGSYTSPLNFTVFLSQAFESDILDTVTFTESGIVDLQCYTHFANFLL